MTVCIDTNAYSGLLRGDAEVQSVLESADTVVVPTVVLGEIYAGFAGGAQERSNLAKLARFLRKPGIEVNDITDAVAARYGRIVQALRSTGTPIPTNDMWIAAVALECGAHVLTFDRRFTKIPTLIVSVL